MPVMPESFSEKCQPTLQPGQYGRSASQMTPPRTVLDYAKRFLLYKVHDRIMPLYYRKITNCIKCLTFHYLFENERDHAHDLFTAIKTQGDFISTCDLLEMVAREKPVSGRYFHLSIDDGFANIATNAHPIFLDLKIPYTFFVCPAFIDKGSVGELDFMKMAEYARPLPLSSWATLAKLANDGVEIGSHTRSHVRLSRLKSIDNLKDEIQTAKAEIEKALGYECISFAWPFGRGTDIDGRGITAALDAGYKAIFGVARETINPGRSRKRLFQRHHFEPGWSKKTVIYYLTRAD